MEKMALSVKELAMCFGISLPKAYELTNIEGFPVIRIGRRKIIAKSALYKWLENVGNFEKVEAKRW